ncbi:hypothetical protein F7725_027972, partial [Dissostichus mawsoni]
TGPCAKRIKKENDADPTEPDIYITSVNTLYTVFNPEQWAIKTCNKYDEQFSDENLVIQLGKKDKKHAIATHLPCTCIREGVCLILSHEKEKIEETQGQNEEPIQSKEIYSVFCIDREGGENTRRKPFIRSHAFTRSSICGDEVEGALKTDGRFIDDLGNFTLSDNKDPMKSTGCTTQFSVKDLVEDRIKAENRSEGKSGKSGKSGSSATVTEIYDLLQKQCAGRKELMMRRFPGDSYQKALDLRKEDFGKIQQSFSDVHRVNCVEEGNKKLKDGTKVFVLFNYEEQQTNYHYFNLADLNIRYCHDDLDYAILQLKPVGKKYNPDTTEVKEKKVPPGLLKKFGPMPKNGEACIIGHPDGG